MLRRVAGTRVGRNLSAACVSPSSPPSTLVGAPSRYLAATWPLLSGQRNFSSRSDDKNKKNAATTKQSAAAAAAVAASSTNTAATAAQVFATNERSKGSAAASSSTDEGSSCSSSSTVPQESVQAQQKQQEGAVPAAPAATSGIRSIGIKLSEDDELVRAFNNFSKTVNGCTQEEFLVGVKQAYASLAVVISAFVDKTQQPLVGLTESSKVIAAAHEAAKMLDQEFKPETRDGASAKATATKSDATSASKLAVEDISAPVGEAPSGSAALGSSSSSSPKAKLQETLVRHVVSAITSIIPVSKHLAESIFKIWMLQKEKQVNLSSIASPSDYVLDSKLVIFARLDKAQIFFNSDNIGAEVDVTLNNDYLRKLDGTKGSSSSSSAVAEGGSNAHGKNAGAKADDDKDFEDGMIQVYTDTNANAKRNTAEEHTFVVDKKTRKLTPAASMTAAAFAPAADTATDATPSAASPEKPKSEVKGATISRVQVTCVKTNEATSKASTAAAAPKADEGTTQAAAKEEEEAEDPEACSVFIKVNGNALPPIPADAQACALLTVDVVVPPERYAYNFEWFYKRIIGYENEYERIAAARVFASNSPKSLGNFLDFVMRMITGKSVEFMFSKSIGRMIGIPEDVSETPPATRKLVCMYMDASYKWVLADLITLAPVIETKLPKA